MAALITLTNATLGTDVERGQTTSGTDTVKFRCVVNERKPNGSEIATWFQVEAYGGTARGIATLSERGHIVKGKKVNIDGTLAGREYTDRNGASRMSLDVSASMVEPIWEPRQQQDNDSPF